MSDYGVDQYGRPMSGAPSGGDIPTPTVGCPDGQTKQSDGSCKANAIGDGQQTTKPAPQEGADSKWLNWINKTYGSSKSRGGGFADKPQDVGMGDVINRFNSETGSSAKLAPGASGDMVDFGQGAKDVLTSGGQLWYDYGPGGPPGQQQQQGGPAPSVGNANTGITGQGSAQRLPVNLPHDQLPTYKPGVVQQFVAPDQTDMQNHTKGVIDELLANPTYSADNIAAMKERSKEQAMKMAQDQGGVMAQHYARLGRGDSGEAAAGSRDIQSKMISDILSGNREVDLSTADANRGARERAVGLSGGFMNDTTNRAIGGYDTALRGAMSQEDLNQQGVQSEADRIKFNLQRALSEQGISTDNYRLGQDDQRIAEMIRQFNGNMNYNYGKDAQSYNQWLVDKATR